MLHGACERLQDRTITFITERQTAIQSNTKQNTKATFVGCDWDCQSTLQNSLLRNMTLYYRAISTGANKTPSVQSITYHCNIQ